MKYIVTLSPLLKSALLLCAGLSIFGFADNFIMLISIRLAWVNSLFKVTYSVLGGNLFCFLLTTKTLDQKT